MSIGELLIVNENPHELAVWEQMLSAEGFMVSPALGFQAAFSRLRASDFDVILLDINHLRPAEKAAIKKLKENSPDTEIIVICPWESHVFDARTSACLFEVLTKPSGILRLTHVLHRALERRRILRQNKELMLQVYPHAGFRGLKGAGAARPAAGPDFIGQCPAIQQVRHWIAEVASTSMNVLIQGESGTGKDVVARLIHESSSRRQRGSFVKINCPSIPESLLESELFGHEAGAFTGADKRKPGRLELAANGTTFLDEISEIPPVMQAKLLQFIEQKQFSRLGGVESLHVDTRIIAATNAPLPFLIAEKKFRADLFYRLNEFSIYLPPLRERVEDIPLLVEYFCRSLSEEAGQIPPRVSPSTLSELMRYPWPGNIRELKAVVKRFVYSRQEAVLLEAIHKPEPNLHGDLSIYRVHETEKNLILSALMETHWNQRKAAFKLGLSYSALRRRVSKYNLKNVDLSVKAG